MEVFLIDESYFVDDSRSSPFFLRGLEAEFGLEFEEENVGPGADLPVFKTLLSTVDIPVWSILFGTFFLGKSVRDNLDAWIDVAMRIRRLFTRRVILSRESAAVLAVQRVFSEMRGIPKEIQLLSYRELYMDHETQIVEMPRHNSIDDAPQTITLSVVRHVFEIRADGVDFRVEVDGSKIEAVRID